MTARRFHLRIDVRGALRNRSFDWYQHDDGRPMSRAEAKAELESLLARGIEFIPASSECDGFYPDGQCPGHPIDEKTGP